MALRPLITWITGRPASGKTTLGRALVAALEKRGVRAVLVDSDEVRASIETCDEQSKQLGRALEGLGTLRKALWPEKAAPPAAPTDGATPAVEAATS